MQSMVILGSLRTSPYSPYIKDWKFLGGAGDLKDLHVKVK